MIKNLFNNPWFIGALGVFALLYLGWSIAKPLYFSGDSEVVELDTAFPGPAAAFVEETSPVVPTPKSGDAVAAQGETLQLCFFYSEGSDNGTGCIGENVQGLQMAVQ